MHSLRAVPLLLLTVLAKAEIPSPFHPVTDLNPSCPEVQQYYRRLPAGHGSVEGTAGGQCHRCYCRQEVNGSADCWPRENRRCDDVGRTRVRRGIMGLSSLLFGDGAKKLMKEDIPRSRECTPKTSFSDGCPPADWCKGCTVCDCDSKGQWDCHILSFCSGDEKKNRPNGSKVPVPASIRNKKKQPIKKSLKETKKQANKSKTIKSRQTTKKPNRQTKKIVRRKQNDQKKDQGKPARKNLNAKKVKKIIYKPKPTTNRPKPTEKPKSNKRKKPFKKPTQTKKIIKNNKTTKTPNNRKRNNEHKTKKIAEKTIEQKTINPISKTPRSKTQIRKIVHRVLSKRESNPNINKKSDGISVDSLEQTEMGRKIVKKVLSTLEKLMAKQMAMIQNKTNILRSSYKDCPRVQEIKKKIKKEKPKRKTIQQMTIEEIRERKMDNYINRNSWRVKRDAFDIAKWNSVAQNNNESKMYEVTDADVNFLVKELETHLTTLNVEPDITSTSSSKVSDTSKISTDFLTSTEKTTKTTEIISSSNIPQVLSSTESNFKYYEYLPDNINKTSHTPIIVLNDNHTEIKTTELRSQNDSLNKLVDFTTQNIFIKDQSNNSLLKLENNDTVENYTVFDTKNILTNSIDPEVEYTYYTITTADQPITKISLNSTTDEIIQAHTEKSEFKQQNKTTKSNYGKNYDDIHYKKNKSNTTSNINNRFKNYNVTARNKMRVANLSINDADLIRLIKNKIKNRNKKNKYVVNLKNITKKGKANLYKATSASLKTDNNVTSNATKINIVERKGSLQNLLEKIIIQKKDSVTQSEKTPKYSVFKYLRNIFKKIFSHKKENYTAHKTNEGYTLEVLCDNVGACFKNEHIKVALRSKLHDLNSETEHVFKTIKIIKSLLHLIHVPTNVSNDFTEKMTNNDIKKLNAILKGSYYETNALTAREKSQIHIVKENIHNFIVSVGKFANILYEVLDELYKNNKKYECQRKHRLNKKDNSQKSLNKIKKLLKNYNIVQNTFMKRIYQLIKNAEKNTSSESPPMSINSDNNLNDTPVVDTYSTNIIEKLRKLKNLAQAINSTRRKRWTTKNNDAMEFMLLMLEYLIKQNHPLEKKTANDGIDLLIEAIQNAPSMKSIEKKVLNYNHTKWDNIPTRSKDPRFLRTVTRTTLATPTLTDFIDSEPDKGSNEDKIDEKMAIKYDNSLSRDENVLEDRATIDIDEERKGKDSQRGIERVDNSSFKIEFPEIPDDNITQNYTIEKVGFSKSVNDLAVTEPDDNMITSEEDENNYIVLGVTDAPVEATVSWEDHKLDFIPITNKETTFDWIEESYGKEIFAYRSAKLSTSIKPVSVQTVATIFTTTTDVPDKIVNDISGLTAEIEDEKKPKVKTDLILQRKEMELLNSLDYGTGLPEIDDSISKDWTKSKENSY